MPDPKQPTNAGTCGACGATIAEEAAEPITHCEWCGAEYPSPDADDSGTNAPGGDGA